MLRALTTPVHLPFRGRRESGTSRVFPPVSEPKNVFKENIGPQHVWAKPTLLAEKEE